MKKAFSLFLCLALLVNVLGYMAYADSRIDTSYLRIDSTSLEAIAGKILPESDRPEVISLPLVSKNGHVSRLREAEPDLNSVIFFNQDGTNTMYRFSYPVKYVDENGRIKDKSNAVASIDSESVYYSNYAYVNAENDINTYFPRNLSSTIRRKAF